MAYINTTNNAYPVYESAIRAEYPNTSFAEPFLPPEEYAWVFPAPAPAYDAITQYPREAAPALTAKGNWEQRWEIIDLQAEQIAVNQATAAAQAREAAKAARAAAVEAITVTTAAGNVFDGDETSQTRMARAIIALQATGTPNVNWVLHDNTVIQASVAELSEALALAGAAQAAIWVI